MRTPASEPSYEIKKEVAQDYSLYEKIIASLNLTENMRIALECRQNGLSYPEIGRVLSRAQATVYEYFIKMRQQYSAIYGYVINRNISRFLIIIEYLYKNSPFQMSYLY